MAYKTNVRSMAIKAVDLISNKKGFSSEIIKENIKKISDFKDESLYRELVYGTVENLLYIDYMINRISKIKTNKMETIVLNTLRLALYEIIFLRIETYASVNEYVKIIKKKKSIKTANFVNAILRNSIRKIDYIKKIDTKDKLEFLSIRYSFNEELVKYISDNYGIDRTENIIKALSQRPELSIRVNTFLTNINELKDNLEKKGFKIIRSELASDSLIIINPQRITELDEFKNGLFTIQDQSSIKVSEILNPKENSNILDLCAAPGSKSTHLAQISNNESQVVANDISKDKLRKIKDNFNRMKLDKYNITNHDASFLIKEFIDKFDYVLVDAPCSGLGVIKRKPEIKLYRTMAEIKSLQKLQKKILSNAIKYLKTGGQLVYSTCTIGRLENYDVIKDLLSKNKNLSIIEVQDKKFLEILPDNNNSDGFFIVKLTKN